jgi:hypothetical protein
MFWQVQSNFDVLSSSETHNADAEFRVQVYFETS